MHVFSIIKYVSSRYPEEENINKMIRKFDYPHILLRMCFALFGYDILVKVGQAASNYDI